jgi:tetratricopeptide (TPR) repeat protein
VTRLAAGILLSAVVATAALPAAAGGPVPSAGVARVEAREDQARAACSSGRLQEGASILTELFAQTDEGTYLFNLGRCYQQNGRREEALMRFRAYLRRPDGDPAAVAAAKQYITQLEAPPLPAAVVKDLPKEPPREPPRQARRLRLAGLVAGGIGVGAIGAATFFAVRTHRLQEQQDDAVRAGNSAPGFFEDLNDRGDRAERLQWVFLGVGAAAASAGAVLYYLGRREQSGYEASLLVTPLAGGGGGAMVYGVF